MTEEGRTVQVVGLPTGISEDRLSDKLAIHFLRIRNGGGEITDITFPEDSPTTALITFEESEVAQRVCRQGKHLISVDDRTYEVSVRLPCNEVNPDEIFLRMSMTIDYLRLPAGKTVMKNLKKNFADVQFSFDQREELCTVKGRYSEIQDLANEVLSFLETSESEGFASTKPSKKSPDVSGMADQGRRAERKKATKTGQSTVLDPGNHKKDYPHSTGDGHLQSARQTMNSVEDYSLIMDSDTYRYIQKHCEQEYKRILCKHKVEVVDICCKDVTTLFLQASSENLGSLDGLREAHCDLGMLYQQYETKLRKEQIPKGDLDGRSLKLAYEILQIRFPKILLSEDDSYTYVIGSSSDVSEAKQYFLELGPKIGKQGRFDHDPPSGLKDPLFPASTPLDSKYDKLFKPAGSGKSDGAKDYKLAANFDSCREPVLKTKLTSEDSLFTRPGINTADFLSRDFTTKGSQAFTSGDLFMRDLKGPDRTSEDVLFKKQEVSSTVSGIKEWRPFQTNTPTRTSGPIKAIQFTASPSSLHHMDLLGGGNLPSDTALASTSQAFEFKSPLRRANSFSGRIGSREDKKSSSSNEVPANLNRNTNSSPRKEETFVEEIIVPSRTWLYMKEAYKNRLVNLTSGVHVKDVTMENSTKLTLKGPEALKVSKCKEEIHKLYSMVEFDLTTQELAFSQLGVKDSKDETLAMFCKEMREKYEKVIMIPADRSVYVMGPKELCLRISDCLTELFSAGSYRTEASPTVGYLSAASLSSVTDKPQHKEHSSQAKVSEYLKDQESTTSKYSSTNGSFSQTKKTHTLHCLTDHSEYPSHGTVAEAQVEILDPAYQPEHRVLEAQELQHHQDHSSFPLKGKNDAFTKKDEGHFFLQKDFNVTQNPERGEGDNETLVSTKTLNNNRMGSDILPGRTEMHRIDSGPQSLPTWLYSSHKTAVQGKDGDLGNIKGPNLDQQLPKDFQGLSRGLDMEGPDADSRLQNTGKEQDARAHTESTQTCMSCSMGKALRTKCGLSLCDDCQLKMHATCRVCSKPSGGLNGTMTFTELSTSLSGYPKDMTMKITYRIPDGIQGEVHPHPGLPFKGGIFHAYLPLNAKANKLLPLLKKAFNQGQTFTIKTGEAVDKVVWGKMIPHKTKLEGGKSGNGYPDANYLIHLAEVLKALGIE